MIDQHQIQEITEEIAPEARTAIDVFGSDLPDETFEGVFDQTRQQNWREVDL
jgi:hypothetical protein